MARVRDLWHDSSRRKTARHPDRGGNEDAKRWLAIWLDPDREEKSKTFTTKEAARKYAAKMEADAERGEYVDPKAGREKVGTLAAKHLRLRKVGGSSRRLYESALRNHVLPAFGDRSVKSVRPSEIAEWLSGPMGELSGSVRSRCYLILRGAFELAVADGLRRDNPAVSGIITRPKPDESDREPWDAATVWRVIDAHPQAYRALAIAEAGLGLRQGEACGLAQEDIDFEGGKVTVRRQVSRQGRAWVFKAPKGGRERTVPLSRGMASALRAHIAAYPPEPYALPWLDEKRGKAAGEHSCSLLFRWQGTDPRSAGRHIPAGSYDRAVWKPALAAAGVIPQPSRDGRRELRYAAAPHDGQHAARHFFSVTLQDGGVSLAGVMDFMGHSRRAKVVTVAVYGHVTEETFAQARAVIDAKLFRLRAVESGSSGTVTELRPAQ
jgi:integrase